MFFTRTFLRRLDANRQAKHLANASGAKMRVKRLADGQFRVQAASKGDRAKLRRFNASAHAY